MGRLIAVLALAGAAAFAAHPRGGAREHSGAPVASSASSSAPDSLSDATERDFARRQAEVGLIGSAPLFGAEGLPKPAAR